MLIPASYAIPANGAVGGSGAAYYYTGSDGTNRRKFRSGAAIVEAGWLSGIPSTVVAPVGSNLTIRDVVRYFSVTSNARFSATPNISGAFATRIGKHAHVFPGNTSWVLWS